MTKLKIRKPFDAHLHLREGQMLREIAEISTRHFWAGTVMPNLKRPVATGMLAELYRRDIVKALPEDSHFRPIMTIKLLPEIPLGVLEEAVDLGVRAVKLYPKGKTTHASDGISDYHAVWQHFGVMQQNNMTALFHGESPVNRITCIKTEKAFHEIFMEIHLAFPKLRMVFEHITTEATVDLIRDLADNVAATITGHHPRLTTDDVIGDKCRPLNYCKPVAQEYSDQDALVRATISGRPEYFFGSDSAPWLKQDKICEEGCAGIFNPSVVSIPLQVELFERNNALDKLENFMSVFGPRFYGLKPSDETITLVKEPWIVPSDYNGVVPFMAGKELSWQIAT